MILLVILAKLIIQKVFSVKGVMIAFNFLKLIVKT